jgi:pyridoxal phosphate enzyme (YggS family)
MTFQARLQTVQATIQQACADAKRAPEDVHLIAVSKTRPPESVQQMAALGHVHFGENYAQELRDKVAYFKEESAPLHWHFIGRIQRNKAKYISPSAFRVHTLETEEQATALLKRAPLGIDAMLAVNIGCEAQKSGVFPKDILERAKALSTIEGCRIRGLMCLPPITSKPEESAPYFEEMAYWMDKGRSEGFLWDELSMGMSSDYPIAIQYGATWIRVGTALFGPRS